MRCLFLLIIDTFCHYFSMSSGEVELLSTLLGILLVCVGYLLWFHCRVVCTFAIFKKDTQDYFRVAFARLDALEGKEQQATDIVEPQEPQYLLYEERLVYLAISAKPLGLFLLIIVIFVIIFRCVLEIGMSRCLPFFLSVWDTFSGSTVRFFSGSRILQKKHKTTFVSLSQDSTHLKEMNNKQQILWNHKNHNICCTRKD